MQNKKIITVILGLLVSLPLTKLHAEDTVLSVEKAVSGNITSESVSATKNTSKEVVDNGGEQLKKAQATTSQTPLKLAKIDVSGVAEELKKNIELHMPVTIPVCNADRGDVRLFFDTVKKNLRKASRALGYYDAEFTSGGSIVEGCWRLRLKVEAGRPTKVVGQDIKVIGEGKDEEVFKTILKDLPYKIGDSLNHQFYSDFKSKLSEASQSLGYFDAEFEKRTIRIDPASYQAKIDLLLNTGPRYRYGEVTIKQKTLTSAAIEKYIILKTGKPYKAEYLIKQQQILQRSGYYKTIKIEVLHEQAANNRVPILINLEPKKRNAYKFKVGYGSDTGARVSAELDRRWTGSKGRKLLFKTQYAQTLSGVSLQLVNPRENPEDNSLVYNLDWTEDSNDDVTGRSFNLGAKLIRKRSNGWVQTASINAMRDRTQVEGEDETQSELLLFGVGLEKVEADSLIFPNDGWRISFGLNAASEALLSDQNMVQFNAHAKRIMPFGQGRLLGRASYGSTIVNDFERLPKSLRFFAGGGKSVRGYDFESLGVLNDNDRNRGGKQLIDLSLEYHHPIKDEWSAAMFVDAGNAFDDFDKLELKVGVGFGARWRSPVGPVKIDIGFPADDFSEPKLYLSVGSDL